MPKYSVPVYSQKRGVLIINAENMTEARKKLADGKTKYIELETLHEEIFSWNIQKVKK